MSLPDVPYPGCWLRWDDMRPIQRDLARLQFVDGDLEAFWWRFRDGYAEWSEIVSLAEEGARLAYLRDIREREAFVQAVRHHEACQQTLGDLLARYPD